MKLFNEEIFECYSCINPFFPASSFHIQDLHFEKGCEKPSSDRIIYFYYRTREGKEMYFYYHEQGFRLYHSLSEMYRGIQNHEYYHDDLFPCMRWKHYRITKEYIDKPDGENILHYQGWLKCGHIESNYSYEKISIPLITFEKREEKEISKKQIIDSFQYLFVTPTFYSIFYYDHGKYKIFNRDISSFKSSDM